MTVLRLLRAGYADRNMPLTMMLGLHQIAELIVEVADEHHRDSVSLNEVGDEAAAVDDALDLVLLGVLALDQQFAELVDPPEVESRGTDPTRLTDVDRLLR